MDIVFFTHPGFLNSQSMPRFANWLAEGMKAKGHSVDIWTAQPALYKLPLPRKVKKYLGYFDQYILFPIKVKGQLKRKDKNTLYVFTDHALGPWVPIVSKKNHVIHCHDFLAQRSALGTISENVTGWTGKKYQSYIRNGYRQGRNFISTSQETRKDLDQFLETRPERSIVIYNGMNRSFSPADPQASRIRLATAMKLPLEEGYLLHVGGNQWYKNRLGIVELYNEWRTAYPDSKLPLLLIGENPSEDLQRAISNSLFKKDILVKSNINDELVGFAYAGASVFLFPSLAEGFGWPIAEAMACGAPVITTAEMPMTEVAGDAGFLISRRPDNKTELTAWTKEGAAMIDKVLNLSIEDRAAIIAKGLRNAGRFDSGKILNEIEQVYYDITNNSN